jgi:hypothetical protein
MNVSTIAVHSVDESRRTVAHRESRSMRNANMRERSGSLVQHDSIPLFCDANAAIPRRRLAPRHRLDCDPRSHHPNSKPRTPKPERSTHHPEPKEAMTGIAAAP